MKKTRKGKYQLSQLKVQSFVTTLEDHAQIKGIGGTGKPESLTNLHSTCNEAVFSF